MSTEASAEKGAVLLALARAAIGEALGETVAADASAPWLDEPGATFVTLTLEGRLRGCIGSLEAHRPLRDDVRANARAAAFHDPRFPALTREEWPEIAVEVSLLSPLVPLDAASEAEVAAKLRPFEDGVVLEYGFHRGTFLPQVWEQLPDPRDFLTHLKVKAGLPPDFWATGVKFLRYGVEKWKEGASHGQR